MNDKMKNNIILILGAAVILLLAYVLFSGRNASSDYVDPRLVAGKDSKSDKSPYHRVEVKNTMTKYIRSVQECYNTYLKTNPAITDGELMVDWQIDPEGDVEKAGVVRSEFNSKTLETCITDIISKIEFPPPPSSKNVYADYKFFFKKSDGEGGVKSDKPANMPEIVPVK